MPWDESIWLVEQLLTDPANHLVAAVLEWDHPASRDWMLLASLHDLTVQINTKKGRKAERWSRPWREMKKRGRTSLSPDAAKRVLARLAGR